MGWISELPDYIHLDGYEIDEAHGVLNVNYSEPDQGGTRLLLLYRVPLIGDRDRQPWLESGYTFDSELRRYTLDWEEVPARVKDDAGRWLVEQIKKAEFAGRASLAENLRAYLRTVNEGAV